MVTPVGIAVRPERVGLGTDHSSDIGKLRRSLSHLVVPSDPFFGEAKEPRRLILKDALHLSSGEQRRTFS